ncbi:site-specific integrase [Ruminococcus sp.]|uniref:site-specific integrase n=1 Tax=Ruminococcus sp. TaxID=41978 RepID=UPI0025E649BE|nr:site-specific integrase [Ruminococcus sp.]
MKAKKLPSGNYRVQVVAGYDVNGKRIVKSFTAKQEWEALKLATEFIGNSEQLYNKNVPLAQAMVLYIESRKNIIEETTISSYNQILKYRFKSLMNVNLCDLKPMMIQQAINIDAETVSPKTLKNAYGLLKSVFKMFDVHINLNNVKLPKLKKREKELPSFEELFPLVKGTDAELPVLLAAWLSLRIGEVIGLKFKDVNTINHTISVRRTIIKTENGYKVRDGCKTEKSQRKLELPDYIYDMIMAIPHNSDEDFIIPFSRKIVYDRFKKVMKQHNIDITFHDLRHLNASIMLMLGVPDKYAMERGGWSTDNILKSVYQQTFSSERKKIDRMIDGYFNGIIQNSDTATA